MTREALLALAERLEEHAGECNFRYNDWADDMREAAAALRALATPPAGETPQGEAVCPNCGGRGRAMVVPGGACITCGGSGTVRATQDRSEG